MRNPGVTEVGASGQRGSSASFTMVADPAEGRDKAQSLLLTLEALGREVELR